MKTGEKVLILTIQTGQEMGSFKKKNLFLKFIEKNLVLILGATFVASFIHNLIIGILFNHY